VTVYCATSNSGKLREFQLAAPDFDLRQLPHPVPPPDETGSTFEENAIGKAKYYGRFADGYLFADDSGLEVDALGGAPGVHSARYAGPEATDADNNALLLQRLTGVTGRRARFVCVIALVKDGQLVRTFRGSVEGRILEAPRGSGGFGYDPLFLVEGSDRTMAELAEDEKNRISHRARAMQKLRLVLEKTLAERDALTRAVTG